MHKFEIGIATAVYFVFGWEFAGGMIASIHPLKRIGISEVLAKLISSLAWPYFLLCKIARKIGAW